MAQVYYYPASSASANASVSPNGSPIPGSSTLIAGKGPTGLETPVAVDSSGNIIVAPSSGPVTVVQPTGSLLHATIDASALPTGASTSAFQGTGNTSLASIDSKTPALGQQVAAASQPVVLTAAQLATLTPLSSVTVTQATGTNLHAVIDNFPATQPVSGTVTVQQATGTNLHAVIDNFPGTQPVSGTVTVTQATGTNLHTVIDSSALPSGASTAAKQPALGVAGTPSADVITVQGAASMTPILVNGSGSTQPVSGTVTVTQAAGTNLHAVIDSGTVVVTQATGTNLHAVLDAGAAIVGKVGIDQTTPGTTNGVVVNSSALPTGAATASNQTSGAQQTQVVQGANVLSIGSAGNILVSGLSAVGAAPSLNPVSVAGIDGGGLKRHFLMDTSGRLEIDTVQSLPLPAGAATSALQTQLSAQLPTTIGQKTAAASLAVVLASDQTALPASGGRTPVGFVRNLYATTNVTPAAYVQLFASTSAITNTMEIFDSSGQTLKIAFGGAGSEVDQFVVFPGGNGAVSVKIPAATRVSIKALSATASSGEIDINLYG